MTAPIYIIGAGGFGREVLWLIRQINAVDERFDIKGFLDDDSTLHGQTVCDVPVLGPIDQLRDLSDASVALGVGIPRVKRAILERIGPWNAKFPSLVAPDVQMSEYVEIGQGAIITAGCIITTQVSVGDFAVTNLACTLGHDVVVGKGATLSPGVTISGYVQIGEFVDVGTNASVIPGVSIGAESVVGAGAVIIRDVPEKATIVGNPGKVIKQGS
jgi:sugar O-acyltransferase (sialic acid O-acetyltransferase NeuD family)